MKQDARSKRRKQAGRGRSPLDIGIEIFAIAALIIAAFFTPQVIFQVQDTILCSKITLGERENIDVEALRTTYERSLYKRLLNFAEGLSGGDNFYLTDQELAVSDEVYEFLDSRDSSYMEFLRALVELNIVPVVFWDSGYEVTQWKQYVIYSDNYAKGVNFILWYIELLAESGTKMKMLADAETGTLYAVKISDANEMFYNSSGNYLYSYFWMEDIAPTFWYYFCRYYESVSLDEADAYFRMRWDSEQESAELYAGSEGKNSEASSAEQHTQAEGEWMENAGYRLEDHQMRFRLPYGAASLEVLLWIGDMESESKFIYHHPDTCVGIRQIYELIPEFA